MGRKRFVDDRQMSLPFETQVEAYCQAAQSILDHAQTSLVTGNDASESEIELNVGLVTACKEAIVRSGMSRDQVLDRANAMFGRTGQAAEEAKKPLSMNMLNNYLSKPVETRLPTWLLYAISGATRDLGPMEHLVAKLGGVVIGSEERTELLLGKLDRQIRQATKIKRELLQHMRRNAAAHSNTEAKDYGKEEEQRKSGSCSTGTDNGRAKRAGNGRAANRGLRHLQRAEAGHLDSDPTEPGDD